MNGRTVTAKYWQTFLNIGMIYQQFEEVSHHENISMTINSGSQNSENRWKRRTGYMLNLALVG